jgi:pyruvate-formate lyase
LSRGALAVVLAAASVLFRAVSLMRVSGHDTVDEAGGDCRRVTAGRTVGHDDPRRMARLLLRTVDPEDRRPRLHPAQLAPYDGDASFLAGATERTTTLWAALSDLMAQERASEGRRARRVGRDPAGITAHRPGYLDRDRELIVNFQTDAPLKRAIVPNGGWRMVEASLKAYGFEPDARVREIFTTYRKTHNDGVFDAYTAEILAARRSHVITGLPDAYGRGRIIGDYRRVALYGTDTLIEHKRRERAELDAEIRHRRGHSAAGGACRIGDGSRQADAVLWRARQPRQDAPVRDQRRA